jgi:antitoxin component YwqK of YwqJK toxin-antitoxin module
VVTITADTTEDMAGTVVTNERRLRVRLMTTRVVRETYQDGSLKSEYTEIDGEIQGVRRYWYQSGQLLSELEFVNGIQNGQIREWTER